MSRWDTQLAACRKLPSLQYINVILCIHFFLDDTSRYLPAMVKHIMYPSKVHWWLIATFSIPSSPGRPKRIVHASMQLDAVDLRSWQNHSRNVANFTTGFDRYSITEIDDFLVMISSLKSGANCWKPIQANELSPKSIFKVWPQLVYISWTHRENIS